MIEKLSASFYPEQSRLVEKINELVEASNRQDRAITCLLAGHGNVRSVEGDSLSLRMSNEDAAHWKSVAERQVLVDG